MQKYFLMYLFLIAGLSVWLLYLHDQENRQIANYAETADVARQAQYIVGWMAQSHLEKIRNATMAYNIPYNVSLSKRAKIIQESSEISAKSVEARLAFAYGRDDQKALLMGLQDLDHVVAKNGILAEMSRRAYRYDQFLNAGIMPGLLIENPDCIRVGDRVQGQMYEIPYLNLQNATMFVNNQAIPVQGNLGIFRQVYHTPGVKKLTAEIRIKNPLTKETRTHTKDFEITVCN